MKNNIIVILVLMCTLLGCTDNKKTLHIFSWADYTSPELLQKFESRYNCRVCVDTFDSNESMYAKLKAGASGYDICVPSSYMVKQLIKDGLITKIDHTKINNVIKNFDHSFDAHISDSNMIYSIPYASSYAGVMCLTNKVKTTHVSWSIFSDSSMTQKMSLLDDIRETVGIGLMYNGYSINSENKDEIEKAVSTIRSWKKNIRKFDAESYKTEVASKSTYVGHAYSSDAFQVILGDDENQERVDITFILPNEGFTIAWDEMVILNSSQNIDLALKFIDFVYEEENSLENMIYNISPLPHKGAIEKLPEQIKKLIILDKDTLKRGQVIRQFKNPETINLYNKAWDEIKSTK